MDLVHLGGILGGFWARIDAPRIVRILGGPHLGGLLGGLLGGTYLGVPSSPEGRTKHTDTTES